MLKLMICFHKPRTLRRKPRRQWLMLLDWLMNSDLNKSILEPKRRPSVLLRLKLLSLKADWLKLMKSLPREDVMPWLSLNHAFVNLRLNLAVFNAELLRLTRPSKRLSVESRSFNSNKMRTTRTKTECLNLPTNFNKRLRHTRNKSRRLRKLLPLTWPNIARLNKDLKKLKRELRWLELKCLWLVLALFFKWFSSNSIIVIFQVDIYGHKQQTIFTLTSWKAVAFQDKESSQDFLNISQRTKNLFKHSFNLSVLA